MLIAQENKNMAREGFGPKVQLFTILILNFPSCILSVSTFDFQSFLK